MLLTKKKDILRAMEEDIKGASDSTINWLASSFNVSLHSESRGSRRGSGDYSSRIPLLIAELRAKGLDEDEAEKERNLFHLGYDGVGYGYSLKSYYPKTMKRAKMDVEAPKPRRLKKLIAAIEEQDGL